MGVVLNDFGNAMGLRLGLNETKLGRFKQFEVGWFWNRIAILAHKGKVHFHGFCHSRPSLFECSASGNTTWQIRRISPVTRRRLFK
jgi:hypothetical protein